MISKSLEEYIKTMYVLKKQNGNVRVTDVADKMGCSKASVNKALNNLKDNELVKYETYGTIEITSKGEDLAQKIIESYDIIYVFLKDVLGMESEKAKTEAENMKSAMSDETINKLARYVHQVLGLRNLNCNYDVGQEKCRKCVKRVKRKENKDE
ncbi:MAG: metal-dependent transcriptional regulator [Clostridia bacterium]|nr:metal-dependent transcriptional regulator [Clostridia bacterium]